ncbi:MAG: hypothetical protein OXH11_16165 [Candidatus Aminicenantes bacterium]|nr:hypothetical protein [Candidatus Aminicenantes bacterium]
MTLELMAIIAATITLGGLILTQFRAAARERAEIRERMSHLEVSLEKRMARLEGGLRERMARMEVSLGERMARTEGTLDVLREYFVGSGRGAA